MPPTVQLSTDIQNPNNSVEKVHQPRQIECQEGFVILLSNACPHPGTMVVESLDAHVTIGTVYGTWRLIHAVIQEMKVKGRDG